MDIKLILLAVFIILLILPAFSAQLKEKLFHGDGFHFRYPSAWENSNDNGIVHFFPTGNYAGITITVLDNIALSEDEIRSLLLEPGGFTRQMPIIVTSREKEYTTWYFEYTNRNIRWQVKAFHKNEHLYILNMNCEADRWESNKGEMLKAWQSFTLQT